MNARIPLETDTAGQPADAATLVDGRRLVFIGGLHRSGTSLVHRCLSDHSQVSGFSKTGVPEDEGQHLQTVYRPAHAYGGPGRFGFNPESHHDENSALVTPANAEKLLTEWLKHWDVGKRYLVEKSPPNLVRTRFLQALFPASRFIIVQRHPVAVAYATQKWTPRGTWVGSLIEHWLVCHERFEQDRAKLDSVHVIRYEDFVAKPQEHLDDMATFLSLPAEPLKREVRPGVNDRYLAKWNKRRRNLITRPYAQHLIRRFEDRLNRFGYSLSHDV